MSYKVQSHRDPYPFPKLQNDDNFVGTRQTQQITYGEPTHLSQQQDPWNRLNSTCTLASSRREVYHHDPKAPRDSLDFVLKTSYDQHNSFLATKPETLVQPETTGVDHGRTLKNKPKETQKSADATKPPLAINVVVDPKRETIDCFNGAIDSPHSAATNPGYSRKHDGGFYTT
ncbi:protein CFAP276-like [Ptychodera flava]|uniref:protein CFAP276-like n=1 Tax=Ptychodera flava TaxID=63121 RepID=UPI00396A0FC7